MGILTWGVRSMGKWELLGIEPTTDTLKIKEAYLETLSQFHPEEDPEGFKNLRNTYEELLELASKGIEVKKDTSPLGIWISEIDYIYNSFENRLDENVWKEILNKEISFSLDTKEEACFRLLEYLMENYYLPQKIWNIIDDIFSIKDRYLELYELFPKQFIDYVINEITYGDSLNYSLFSISESKDYDEYITLYYNIRSLLNRRELDEIDDKLQSIKLLDVQHPYTLVLEGKYNLLKKNIQIAKLYCDELLLEYDKDIQVLSLAAEVEWEENQYERAMEFYNEILKISPESMSSKCGVADCLLELGKFKEAHEIYFELISLEPYSNYLRSKLYYTNDRLINIYYEELKRNSSNKEVEFHLAWALFENFRYDEALKVTLDINIETNRLYEYYDLLGRIYSALKEYDNALNIFSKWVKKIEKDIENNTIDYEKSRPSHAYFQKGRQLHIVNRIEEALYCYNKAIHLNKDILYLNAKGKLLIESGSYEEGIDVINESLNIDDNQPNAYIIRGRAYFDLQFYRESMDDTEKALELYPYFTDAYLLKVKIYDMYDRFEDMLAVIDEFESLELNSLDIIHYKLRALSHINKISDAKKIVNILLENIEKKEIEDTELLCRIYYEIAMFYLNTESIENALLYIDKSIKANIKDMRSLGLKGYLLKENSQFDEAILVFESLIKEEPENTYAYNQIAHIYKSIEKYDLALSWFKEILTIDNSMPGINLNISEIYEIYGEKEEAIKYLSNELEIEESEYCYIHRGIMHAEDGRFDEALEDYNNALRIEPKSKYAINNIGCLYKDREDYFKAIEYFEKAIELDEDGDFINCYNNIYKCYYKLKDYEKSIYYCDLGIKVLPNEESLYKNKGNALIKINKLNEAEEAFLKVLEIDEKEISSLVRLGEIYILNKQYDKALGIYSKIIDINPEDNKAYGEIANIYLVKEQYQKAIYFYKEQFKTSKDIDMEINLAFAYKNYNKKINSWALFKKITANIKKNKALTSCHYCQLAKCALGLNNYNEAILLCNEAINLSRDDSNCYYEKIFEAYIILSALYEKRGEKNRAIKLIEKSLEIKGEKDIDYHYALVILRGDKN